MKENFRRFKKARESKKKVYYESFNLNCAIGNRIRKMIQEDNVRIIENTKHYIVNIYKNDPSGIVGGALHICLDDLNLNDDDIIYCLENTIPKIKNPYWHSQYYYCAISLLMLSYSKRLKVVKSCSK